MKVFPVELIVCLVSVSKSFEETFLLVNAIDSLTWQFSCKGNISLTVFYRKKYNGAQFVNVVKIASSYQECVVTSSLKSEEIQCKCINNSRVLCNVTERGQDAERIDQWRCATFHDAEPSYSNIVNVSMLGIRVSTKEQLQEVTNTTKMPVMPVVTSRDGSESKAIPDIKDSRNIVITVIIASSTAGLFFLLLTSGFLSICIYRQCNTFRTESQSVPIMLSGNQQTNMLATTDHVSDRETEERPTTVNQYDWISYIDILPSTCNDTATTSTETLNLATSCVQCYEIIPEMPCLQESVEDNLPGIPGQDISRYENLRRTQQDEMSVYTEISCD